MGKPVARDLAEGFSGGSETSEAFAAIPDDPEDDLEMLGEAEG
jgi:hypothetical protein